MKLLALALALFLVPQDEKITLKFNPRKGDKATTTGKTEVKLKFSIEMGDEPQEVEFEQRGSSKRTIEYVEAENGKVTRLVVDCAEDFEEKKQPPTMEWVRTDNAMHGRKVTILQKDGQVVREGADGLKEKELKKLDLTIGEPKFFPDKPVAVGDSWDVKGDAVKEFINAQDEIKDASLKVKVKEVKEIDKRRCAVLTAVLEMSGKAENDVTFNGKLDVDIVVWIDRGYVLSAKGKGKVTLKGDGDQFKISGEGPITIETTVKVE